MVCSGEIWKVMVINRFRGKYDHTIDDKGRLSFPSRFREVLRQYQSEILIAIPWENHLRAYPLSEWENLENKLRSEDQERLGDFDRIIRYLESESYECVVDKQGRILLPPALRAELGLRREIVLIGMIDRVEIWDKETWEAERRVVREHFGAHKDGIKKRGII
jgi:MraZ protein